MNFNFLNVAKNIKEIDCEIPFDVVTTPGIVITSPDYPENYGQKLRCQTNIELAANEIISIEFEEFALEDTRNNGTCYDYLEIVQWGDSERYCGDSLNGKTIYISGNKAELIFHSDESNEGTFKFQVNSVEGK